MSPASNKVLLDYIMGRIEIEFGDDHMAKTELGKFEIRSNQGVNEYTLWGSIFKPDDQTTLGGFYMNVEVDDPYAGYALLEVLKTIEDVNLVCTDERFTNNKVYRLKKYGKLNVAHIDRMLTKMGKFKHDDVFFKAKFEMKKTFRDIYNEAILDGL